MIRWHIIEFCVVAALETTLSLMVLVLFTAFILRTNYYGADTLIQKPLPIRSVTAASVNGGSGYCKRAGSNFPVMNDNKNVSETPYIDRILEYLELSFFISSNTPSGIYCPQIASLIISTRLFIFIFFTSALSWYNGIMREIP